MVKNDLIELYIEDMGIDGAGIGKLDGMAFFVKDAVIGDRVRAKVMKMKKNYGYARLVELLEPSPDRVEPECPLHRPCGGCQIQTLSYEKQLEYKQKKVFNNLVRLGGFSPEQIPMQPILGMERPYHYRNKAQFPVGRDKKGRLVAGFYAARTHDIVPVEDCLLGVPLNQAIVRRILNWMEKYQIEPYEEQTGHGMVRHILIRYGFTSHQIMVCLVINGMSLPESQPLIRSLTELDGMTSISISINTARSNVIMGNQVKTLWGSDYIEDTIGNVRFQISPLSFYQVNPVQTEALYGKALEYAGLTGSETVWDLYCGIGTISLFLAQRAKQVYGVEIISQAVEDARRNAALNGITNAEFFVGKAEEVLPEFYERGRGMNVGQGGCGCEGVVGSVEGKSVVENGGEYGKLHPQVIVVDPPRKGCERKLLETIVQMCPERIVYVSCDSATLARDLKYLCGEGYEMRAVQGVDMFCETVHVETVVLLSKLNVSHHIEVELTIDELDLTVAESKATYEKIKDYVLEHTGLKVSNLYIAQIKQKCGIIERENYNKAKLENAKQPKCPPEKETAIMDALRYFQMI